ncbi:hypothetical protein N7494_005475 [Penicillium frequentans]|uniref:Uncharacterized protein n=1 Tax=Penicillium frequentans TaxID=3151616 RepID=A0AAD6CHE7_9EURO|nr:hypothetical protein N7494_013216 [Penicillium glabrum]KAJ5523021.1 hypothetical protein N7494_013207 [Penicillium glabrum]KAJ5544196.1 hypothetical protein N7494_005475 [Penicillium glabrum]
MANLLRAQLRGHQFLLLVNLSRDHDLIARCLSAGPYSNMQVRDENGMTVLHLAAQGGSRQITEALLGTEQGRALLHATDGRGDTPCMVAARYRNSHVAELLIDAGSRPRAQNTQGETVVYWAIVWRQTKLLHHSLQRGSDPRQTMSTGFTAVTLAALTSSTTMLSILLRANADIDQVDDRGYTALSWAAIIDNVRMAQILLRSGANASKPDDPRRDSKADHQTPLIWAITKGNQALVKLLLQYHADPCGRGSGLRLPLTWAVLLHQKGIARLLLARGASFLDVDACGETPLDFVLRIKDEALLELFKTHEKKYTSSTTSDRVPHGTPEQS